MNPNPFEKPENSPQTPFQDQAPATSPVRELAQQALEHRAVRHPYLAALREGTLPDHGWAVRDFATQYMGYSRSFPQYLTAVISRLEDPRHRRVLMDNLTEESGHYSRSDLDALGEVGIEPSWVEGVPHPELFRRFAYAVCVSADAEEHVMVQCWKEMLLATLTAGSAAEAVGALGLGTENIVGEIYKSLVEACNRVQDLEPQDAVFFQLHTTIDDDHHETLLAVANQFAQTERGLDDLRRGMLKALVCRAAFWDWMHERALNPPTG